MRKRIVKASRNARTARKVSRMSALKASKNIRARKRRVMASMSQDELSDELTSLIEGMKDSDVIYLWNEFCDASRDDTGHIYYMDDFDEVYGKVKSAYDILDEFENPIKNGGFSVRDPYFRFDGYGHIRSFSDINDSESPFYIDELIDNIIDDDNAYGNDDIRELLDSANEDDEDEE